MAKTDDEKEIDNYPLQLTIEGTETIIKQMKNTICQIIKGNTKGTGFFCKVKNPKDNQLITLLITNNHVLNNDYFKKSKTIKFYLHEDHKIKTIPINDRIIFKNKDLDITFIEIKEEEKNKFNIEYLETEDNLNEVQEINDFREVFGKKALYVLHYPEGKKLVSYGILKDINNYDIIHTCSTKEGSSGSPIILIDSFKVIGIHKGTPQNKALLFNKGIFMKNALNQFFKYYNIHLTKKIAFQKRNKIVKTPDIQPRNKLNSKKNLFDINNEEKNIKNSNQKSNNIKIINNNNKKPLITKRETHFDNNINDNIIYLKPALKPSKSFYFKNKDKNKRNKTPNKLNKKDDYFFNLTATKEFNKDKKNEKMPKKEPKNNIIKKEIIINNSSKKNKLNIKANANGKNKYIKRNIYTINQNHSYDKSHNDLSKYNIKKDNQNVKEKY